ncbi:hypothetical protein ZEAMMB73_Zm00001d028691 [Zea mays]|uniref:DUF7953 domain-containing protein n=1 Tax=Zea mays TaxID=4577 RepID=A0A1D6JYL7_MAIZE|nr:hypothetical protein ZEAMMB73_Zm00001d028691 [Zea mays]
MRWPLAISTRRRPLLLFILLVVLYTIPGTFSSRQVTLDTVEIFSTHEWFGKPTVVFGCNGENKTDLPDVREVHTLYTFKGEESWQSFQKRNASDVVCMRRTQLHLMMSLMNGRCVRVISRVGNTPGLRKASSMQHSYVQTALPQLDMETVNLVKIWKLRRHLLWSS